MNAPGKLIEDPGDLALSEAESFNKDSRALVLAARGARRHKWPLGARLGLARSSAPTPTWEVNLPRTIVSDQ